MGGGGTRLVSIGLSQQHPHTWIHTYCKTPLISVVKSEIPGDTALSHRTLNISYGGNIFPKEIVFLLWHCWRCAICKRKSENSHSRGDRLGWWWDESGAPLSQMGWPLCWGNDWEQHRARGAEWHPTKHCTTARAPNANALTAAQPVKYQVKHACCATGQLCCFIGGGTGGQGWCRR